MKTTLMILALAFAGCGKKADEPAKQPPATGSGSAAVTTGSAGSATATGSGAGSGSAAAAAVDVPTEMDFETQAKTDLTDKNVEAQVKAIEDDLGKN